MNGFIRVDGQLEEVIEDVEDARVFEKDRGEAFRKSHKAIKSIPAHNRLLIVNQLIKMNKAIGKAVLNVTPILKVNQTAEQ